MNKLFILCLVALLSFTSCKKGSDGEQPDEHTNQISIGINGVTYATIKIGNKTWTAENYNGSGGLNYGKSAINIPEYGKLYTLAEATAIPLPKGWRLPTKDDYIDLMKNLGTIKTLEDGEYLLDESANAKLRSTTGWTYQNGNNGTGFNGLPAGDVFIYSPSTELTFECKGEYAQFWTSSPAPDTMIEGETVKHHWVFELTNRITWENVVFDYADVYNSEYPDRTWHSIRFVKDN